MNMQDTVLGIELGSTRIKAVLVDKDHAIIASGSHEWENILERGVWTYHYEDIINGVQDCFMKLQHDVMDTIGVPLTTTGAIGVSAMMHGYLALDEHDRPLTEFRTWRNRTTGKAAKELSEKFSFNIPLRWSVAHLYQAVLNREEHVTRIKKITTLAGYIHYLLTGKFIVGVGDASGIFPIDTKNRYDESMMKTFNHLVEDYDLPWNIEDILPAINMAGEQAGRLTETGARLLDPTGTMREGILFAPPEGDAGTGMTATNSVRVRSGNVSAGTSAFAMIVLDKPIEVHREIDIVTTPTGKPVAMIHCSNCTSDINAWINLFGEFAENLGVNIPESKLYRMLYSKALEGRPDCEGLLSYNYYSGEGITDFDEGRPVLLRKPDAKMDLASFMRTHMTSALATLRLGMDILKDEHVEIDRIYGHGGYFKTPEVGQRILSAAIDIPVSIMQSAAEGGPYGMALLCAYMIWNTGESLEDYLDNKVFDKVAHKTLMASSDEVDGFGRFISNYRKALKVERAAVESF
ncbi:MAG: FGGY-family carbohydrate kinase [Sphaerochaetaceae bacterium]|jgi:sugar (pentulose or hexulose) kinase|nr:FGGY-family carbohydrate kinase [Sphaerochaetaceae bacterium]NLO61042.1 ATPase [Spirochaetales bacterium]MDD2406042.1 FGGY-family carbohydrate kinase [Sphaerochaetaceae bacterium]MDD3670757.1 FGGY-family carbohydrate kinase [Sphaerochaetaceae bacterium]MDD4260520.1 FGGY-family carbohydrate kinase [Sphaerochaetaceae bacterium]